VIWGENDRMVPRAHGEAYAKLLPNAKLAVIPGAGHSAHVEKPDEAAQLIADFLAQ
jgi:pimeloyl-ACP methyl ester carboxylesterase